MGPSGPGYGCSLQPVRRVLRLPNQCLLSVALRRHASCNRQQSVFRHIHAQVLRSPPTGIQAVPRPGRHYPRACIPSHRPLFFRQQAQRPGYL